MVETASRAEICMYVCMHVCVGVCKAVGCVCSDSDPHTYIHINPLGGSESELKKGHPERPTVKCVIARVLKFSKFPHWDEGVVQDLDQVD
jgi:hypothetical protein